MFTLGMPRGRPRNREAGQETVKNTVGDGGKGSGGRNGGGTGRAGAGEVMGGMKWWSCGGPRTGGYQGGVRGDGAGVGVGAVGLVEQGDDTGTAVAAGFFLVSF
jgi:hypothetical protein